MNNYYIKLYQSSVEEIGGILNAKTQLLFFLSFSVTFEVVTPSGRRVGFCFGGHAKTLKELAQAIDRPRRTTEDALCALESGGFIRTHNTGKGLLVAISTLSRNYAPGKLCYSLEDTRAEKLREEFPQAFDFRKAGRRAGLSHD